MKINEAIVPHYTLKKEPPSSVLKEVSISKEHLKEKNTWYNINGKLCFFKPRDDYRIIGELLSSAIQRALGLDSVIYELAYINGELGLISENFQVHGNGYYHVNDLYKSNISSVKAWGKYSFQVLHDYFEVKVKDPILLKNIRKQMAELFICDYLTHQEDRNYNNMMFQMQVKGLNHKPGEIQSIHGKDITDISLSKIFDSEKSFSIGRDGVYDYNLHKVWDTSFLVTPDSSKGFYEEGIDKNLFDLYVNYPQLAEEFMKKIVNELNIQKILEKFQQNNSQLIIRPNNISYLDSLITTRQEEINGILSL